MSGEETTTATSGDGAPDNEDAALSEEQIREKMRNMTAKALKTGRIDADGVKEFGRALGAELNASSRAVETAGEAFSEAVRRLDATLMQSAQSAHSALSALSAKGDSFTDNDLKEALEQLKQLQRAYMETSARIAEAAGGGIQREFQELARHAQNLGSEASSQVASMVNEFAGRLTSTSSEAAQSGLDLTRQYGMRMAYVTSGVLAGIADALKEQSATKKSE